MADIELVIKMPEEAYNATCNGRMLPPDVENVVNAIANGTPLPERPRWIPVSERLPEDGGPVLIYAWNVHHVVARYDIFRTENGYKKCWVTADAWNGNTEIKHAVIAWMPMSTPYEGGDKK